MPDFDIENHGSLYLVRPATQDAHENLQQHVSDDAQWFCGALGVEARYVFDLAEALAVSGFEVR
jgi:hypothetical protein